MSIQSLSESLSSFMFSTSINDKSTLSNKAASDIGADDLPSEMLERIFLLLGPQDLKAVVLVCRCQSWPCPPPYHHNEQEVARGG